MMKPGQYWDISWGPIRGCSHASEGCRHCYAERMAARFSRLGYLPFAGFAETRHGNHSWTGRVELIEHRLDMPLRWRKPRRVFMNSASDLFHENLSDETIARVFGIMSACPQHTFLVLTKRPHRMLEILTTRDFPLKVLAHQIKATCQAAIVGDRITLPLVPLNVQLVVSIEDQATADARIPLLLQTPARARGVSVEPMLGPVDLHNFLPFSIWESRSEYDVDERKAILDWVACGSETGPGASPCNLDWVRSLRDQCQVAGVPFFLKQTGNRPGKDRVLDGRTWDELP